MDTIKLHCSVELYTLDPGGAHLELAPHDLLDFQAVIFTFNKIISTELAILLREDFLQFSPTVSFP